MQPKKQLCKIPDFIEFQYHPEQELHAFIQIENLTDQITTYKIKTTAPVEYLVKPMEGQIYKRQKAKVVFKRKKLPLQNYQAIQNGTKPFKQKFMFIVSCRYKNAIGIQKVQESSHIMNVKFTSPRNVSPLVVTVKQKDQDDQVIKKAKKVKTPEQRRQQNEIKALIQSEKQKLEGLKKQREQQEEQLLTLKSDVGCLSENTTESKLSQSGPLRMEHIICLIVLAFLLGVWL